MNSLQFSQLTLPVPVIRSESLRVREGKQRAFGPMGEEEGRGPGYEGPVGISEWLQSSKRKQEGMCTEGRGRKT